MRGNPTFRNIVARGLFLGLGGITSGAWLGGCGSSSESQQPIRPLTAEQFVARGGEGRATGNPIEASGEVAVPGERLRAKPERPEEAPPVTEISPVVSSAVPRTNNIGVAPQTQPDASPGGAPLSAQIDLRPPATRPAVPFPVGPNGTPIAMDVGFVVLDVNGTPIYSNKVLNALASPLATEARRNDRVAYQKLAAKMLMQQVSLYRRNELEIAAAENALDANDKVLAKALTVQWRQKQITAAGGSLELAKRKAAAEGADFEEKVIEQNRWHMVQIFYQKRIYPRIQVAASDIRDYYNQNKDKEFTTLSKMKFRVIKFPKKGTIPAELLTKVEEFRQRAKTEDFIELAKQNADPSGGRIGNAQGWIDKGAYRYEVVEQAVAALQPGQVSEPINYVNQDDRRDDAYFIAKLEAVQKGSVQPFEDQAVQDKITRILKGREFESRQSSFLQKLELTAVTDVKKGAMEAMLEMVMRQYPIWAGQASGQ